MVSQLFLRARSYSGHFRSKPFQITFGYFVPAPRYFAIALQLRKHILWFHQAPVIMVIRARKRFPIFPSQLISQLRSCVKKIGIEHVVAIPVMGGAWRNQ